MADTQRSRADLNTLLADNTSGDISPQDIRDMLETLHPSYGSNYISTPATTSITDSTNYFKCAGTTTDISLRNFSGKTALGVDNRLRYDGAATVHIHGAVTISFSLASGTNKVLEFDVYHYDDSAASGAVVGSSKVSVNASSSAIQSTALHFDLMLDTNDYIELHVKNTTDTTNVQVDNMYLFMLTMIV